MGTATGESVGAWVGSLLGALVGDAVAGVLGWVGSLLGAFVGDSVGAEVVLDFEGRIVGPLVAAFVVGLLDGDSVLAAVGKSDGDEVGG